MYAGKILLFNISANKQAFFSNSNYFMLQQNAMISWCIYTCKKRTASRYLWSSGSLLNNKEATTNL